jgi:hypothetical protein
LTARVTPDGRIQLTWEAALQGEKYELSYAPVISATPGTAPSASDYVPQEAFKPVFNSGLEVPEAKYPQGRAVVLDGPDRGKSYAYKLVVTKGGAKSSESVKVVAEAPYTTSVSFSLSVSAPVSASTEHLLNADEIRLRVVNEWGAGGTGLDSNAYTFQVYYRVYDNPQSTYQAFGSPVSYAATDEDKYVTVTGLTIGRQYQFKVVVSGYENSNIYQRETTGYAAGYNVTFPPYASGYYTAERTTDPRLPARSLRLYGGGNGLAGRRVKVEYPSTATSGTSIAELTVEVKDYNSGTDAYPSWQHVYYIQLPANVITGWDSTTYHTVTVLEHVQPISNDSTPFTYNNVYGN